MMDKVTLAVQQRSETGKGPARRLRATGNAPAVLYGQKVEPIKLAVNVREFRKIIAQSGSNVLFDLQISGGDAGSVRRTAIMKERQIRPVDGEIIHLDFLEIVMTEAIEVAVPIRFDGKPVGLDKGGLFQAATRELKVSCLPDDIPNEIVVDISGLDLGHSLHVGEIELPNGVSPAQDPSLALATVVAQKKGEEAEAPAEPTPEAQS
jgi:large subunit ribosomal protein L25